MSSSSLEVLRPGRTIDFVGIPPFSLFLTAFTLDTGFDSMTLPGISTLCCFLFFPFFLSYFDFTLNLQD
ncbi:hypothetical protein ACTXT7_012215 [Hymenolepis weldensis]